jgi:hypothetical protein
MKEKQAVTREYKPRYQKAGKKAKSALLDEFTRLTGYHRKSAVRLPGGKPVREVLVSGNGKTVKFKPEKKRPPNRKGKRIYTDEVIASLRLVWAFFWYKCGKILAPLMRQQMPFIAQWPAFHITEAIAEKLMRISPASIDRYLKKDRDALRAKGKSLTKPPHSLKSRIPIRVFYTAEERNTPGFWQIDTVHHCGQATTGQYVHTLTATDVSSGWIELRSLLNNARSWTFKALSDIKQAVPFPILEFHRKQSFRAITARNLSTTPPNSGANRNSSPLPAPGTAIKTTTVSWSKKTAPSSANTRAMTGLKGWRNRPSSPPSIAPSSPS